MFLVNEKWLTMGTVVFDVKANC